MKKNFFSNDNKQARIEKKIDKLCNSFRDIRIRNKINDLPRNQETLDLIEGELALVIKDVAGAGEREKWANFYGTYKQFADNLLDKPEQKVKEDS